MYEYIPFYSPDITVEYVIVDSGQTETFHQPGFPPEVEITAVKIHEQDIDEYLQTHLLDTHEQQWEQEIVDQLKLQKGVA